MRFDALFIFFCITLVTLAVAHHFALVFFLYWLFPWLDIPMHALGGVVVALGYQSLPSLGIRLPMHLRTFFPTLCAVIIVGLCWELFEFYAGLLTESEVVFDTALDLTMDLLGGALGYGVAHALQSMDEL